MLTEAKIFKVDTHLTQREINANRRKHREHILKQLEQRIEKIDSDDHKLKEKALG